MINDLKLDYFIPHEKQGEYLTLPFDMPDNTAEFSLRYRYPTHQENTASVKGGYFTSAKRVNIIDLGLVGPDGEQVGASGSDKHSLTINANTATPGYTPRPLTPGKWHILVGAYQVAPEGVTVIYNLKFTPKQRKLYLGDLHTHTIASDGVLSIPELARHAQRHGLAFLAISDHNQAVDPAILKNIPGITLIPGIEWTHYSGHASFLGAGQADDQPFFTHSFEEVQARFRSARARGALIIIDHPCDENCGFQFDLNQLPFDCLEIWNGPMRESNFKAVALWQSLLASGKKISAVGGSDYHRDKLFQILGGPCMGVYAMSNAAEDILGAIHTGHSFITFAPQGPTIALEIDAGIMGDTIPWQPNCDLHIRAEGLQPGDTLRVITPEDTINLFQAPAEGIAELAYPVPSPGFARVEIHRTFLPGVPPLPALISNPIYFS